MITQRSTEQTKLKDYICICTQEQCKTFDLIFYKRTET